MFPIIRAPLLAVAISVAATPALAQPAAAAAASAAPAASAASKCKPRHDHSVEKGLPNPKSTACGGSKASGAKGKAAPPDQQGKSSQS